MTTLRDLGERELIRTIVTRYTASGVGHDCAELERFSDNVIITTDPVPPPAAEVIGGDPDPYWKGWLLVIINASDLAAAAATPWAFLAAAEASPNMDLVLFERFMQGIQDACEQEELAYVGGNLREADRLAAVGIAVGYRNKTIRLNRTGINDGDLVVVVGDGGRFWLDALSVKAGLSIADKTASPLFAPRSQSRLMRQVVSENLICASMDNSDGLLSSVAELCRANGIGADIDLTAFPAPTGYERVSNAIGVSSARLWLGWGDWNVLAAAPAHCESKLRELRKTGQAVHVIGRFAKDLDGPYVRFGHDLTPSPRIDSERFARDSWFAAGIDSYIELLKNAPLPGGI